MATGFKLVDPQEYRRGVVLGLTLAEILVLLVFLLLLCMSALILRRDREQAELAQKIRRHDVQLRPVLQTLASRGVAVDTDQLVNLIVRGSEADSLRSQLMEARSELAAMAAESERRERELAQLREAAKTVSQATQALADQDALRAELDRAAPETSLNPNLVERLKQVLQHTADTEAASANIVGQNAQMRIELARLKGNGGTGLPYCWALPDGKPEYMLKVVMHDTGVIASDIEPRPRPADPAWSLVAGLSRDQLLSLNTFIEEVAPLQVRSVSDRCRYAILAVDATAITNKPGYKLSIGRLWSVFNVKEVGR